MSNYFSHEYSLVNDLNEDNQFNNRFNLKNIHKNGDELLITIKEYPHLYNFSKRLQRCIFQYKISATLDNE